MRRLTILLMVTLATAGTAAAQRRAGSTASALEKNPMPKTEAEKRILSVMEDMVKSGKTYLSVPIQDGRVLRIITEATGAKQVVEIGTSTGYSGLWFCLALRTTGGKLTTFEIDPGRASLARDHFRRAGVDDLVTVIEGDAHVEIKKLKGPIDIVFIDAEKEGYLDYLNKLLPLVRPGGMIFAHNVGMTGVSNYNEAVTTSPDLETIFYMDGGGLGVTLKKR